MCRHHATWEGSVPWSRFPRVSWRLDAPPATDEAVAVEFRRGTYVADAVVLDAAGRVLAIEIPPLPDGPEPASARVALLNSSGGVELLCDWHEVSLAPARVEDGALLKLAQGGSGGVAGA